MQWIAIEHRDLLAKRMRSRHHSYCRCNLSEVTLSSSDGPSGDDLRPPPRSKSGAQDSGGGGGGGNRSFCDIVERTRVNSVDRSVLSTLRQGDLLAVVYNPGPPKRLLVTTSAGLVLGSITAPSLPTIIECIINGKSYVAEILLIQGGICEVEIRLQ